MRTGGKIWQYSNFSHSCCSIAMQKLLDLGTRNTAVVPRWAVILSIHFNVGLRVSVTWSITCFCDGLIFAIFTCGFLGKKYSITHYTQFSQLARPRSHFWNFSRSFSKCVPSLASEHLLSRLSVFTNYKFNLFLPVTVFSTQTLK